MSKKSSHICRVCGKEYDGCNYCDGKNNSTFMWRQIACSIECAQEYFRRVEEARSKPHKLIEQEIIEPVQPQELTVDIVSDIHDDFKYLDSHDVTPNIQSHILPEQQIGDLETIYPNIKASKNKRKK